MAFEQLTLITSRAKRNWQYSIRYGCAMQVTHFALGNSGHDPESYVTALTPDPNFDPSPDANNNRYPPDMIAGPLAVTSALDDPYFATVWQCDVPKGTATGVVSSVYLLAKFLWLNPAPLGVSLNYVDKYKYYARLEMYDGTKINEQMGTVPSTPPLPAPPPPYTVQRDITGLPVDDSFLVQANGTTLTRVVGAPASTNEYNVSSTGLITFHASKAGATIYSYSYTASPSPYLIYSMGYFPLSVKTDNEVWTLSCGCQY